MSAFHETVKNILADVDRFLNTTLKEESLSKAAQKEKTKILNSLQKLYEEYEVLNPNLEDGSSNSSKGLADESRLTSTSTHSHGSHGSEEDSYTDNIPFTTVKALTDPLKTGYLVKKPTDFLEKFAKQKKKYCVVHKNILYWYKKYSDKNQQAAIFLLGYEFKDLTQNDREFIFELVSEKKKSILFQADNREDLEDWRKAIEASISSAKQIQLETQAKTGESSMIEEQYEEEYEDIGEIANTVRNISGASRTATATKAPTNSVKLPLPPSVPPQPSSPDDFYDDGESMPMGMRTKSTSQDDDDDTDSIYEFVGQEQLENENKSNTAEELRSSMPTHLPPVPPREAPASQAPPPLPVRGVGIPVPNTSVPKVPVPSVAEKRSPTLDKILMHEDYENLFYGLWSCVGGSTDELTFNRGDVVHVLNRDLDSEGWWIGERDGVIGLVPKAFLSPAYQPVVAA